MAAAVFVEEAFAAVAFAAEAFAVAAFVEEAFAAAVVAVAYLQGVIVCCRKPGAC